MKIFSLDKAFTPFTFEELSIEDFEIISGGSGGSSGASGIRPPLLGPIIPAPIINAVSHAYNSMV